MFDRILCRSNSVVARSKAWVYGLSLTEIAGSNPVRGMDVCLDECWVLSGRVLCDGPITRAEDPIEYGVSVIEEPRRGGLGLLEQSGHEKKIQSHCVTFL